MGITSTFINPFTDYGFKKLFGEESSKPQLISFINSFLELDKREKIVDLEFRNLEKLGLKKSDRKSIYDIYCTDINGDHIIVELQRAEQLFFKDRMVYYSTFPIQEQAIKGLYYLNETIDRKKRDQKVSWDYKLKGVYCIGILDFEFQESKKDDYIHVVKLKDQNNSTFYDKLVYFFVEMPKFNKTINKLETYLDKWFFFLKNLDTLNKIPEIFNNDEIIIDAFKKAQFINLPKKDQDKYLESLKEYRDWYAVLSTAEKKGEQKGLEKAQKEILEIQKEKRKAEKDKKRAEKERKRAEKERKRAEKERERAEKEKERAEKERERAEKEKEKLLQEKNKIENKIAKEREETILKMYQKGLSIDDIASFFNLNKKDIENLLKK